MVRFFNPVKKSERNKVGADNQLHGGTLEPFDQFSNAISESVSNVGDGNNQEGPKQAKK
ncbi:hypothetical protein [Mesobacillus harenae]|uniref:hypothetical protein n=1 Tax=Mesobacillus harenae TaxID=2213203 RepID=UPI001580CC88|nr:hypothetical protein [Mesobacillus harenae]